MITFKGAGYDRRNMGKSEPVLDELTFKKLLSLGVEDRLCDPRQVSCVYRK